MKKLVVYTVLTGKSYDKVVQPDIVDTDIDYILFTDNISEYNNYTGCWKIVQIPFEMPDKGRLSRYPKILPHETILKEYDYSLYIDANIRIKEKYVYERMRELADLDVNMALLQHPFRDCVYQEAYVCIAACKGGWVDIIRQLFFLKKNKIPKHSGLFEANLIFRKHSEKTVVETDSIWWHTFMKYSKRDQLSLVYALRKTEIRIEYFLPKGYTTRNHNSFEKIVHLPQKENKKTQIKRKVVSSVYNVFKKLLKENNNV